MEKIEPMEPILTEKVEQRENFIHQIKWDGIRGMTWMKDGQLRIFNKSGRERTGFYPEVEQLPLLLRTKEAVVDGELVVFEGLHPSFQSVLKRDRIKSRQNLNLYVKQYPVRYILFDCMVFDGWDMRKQPLTERLEQLRSAFTPDQNIIVTDDFSDGVALFDFTKEKNYEGIVSKDQNSAYISGKKHDSWFKTKNQKILLAVVLGVYLKQGLPNSLILGVYDQGDLVYVGNVATGLKESDKKMICEFTKQLKQEQSPLKNFEPNSPLWWFKPVLTCWVRFMEWTSEGVMRHPVLLGFSDSPAKDAILEEQNF